MQIRLKYLIAIPLLLFITGSNFTSSVVTTPELTTFEKLASMPNLVSIEKIALKSHFNENYELWFYQPIDHKNSSKGI